MPFVGPFVISLLVSSFWSSYAPFCYSIWHTFSSQQYDTVNIQRLLILKCFICCNCTNDQAVQVLNYPNCSMSYLGREELVTIPAHARCAHTHVHTLSAEQSSWLETKQEVQATSTLHSSLSVHADCSDISSNQCLLALTDFVVPLCLGRPQIFFQTLFDQGSLCGFYSRGYYKCVLNSSNTPMFYVFRYEKWFWILHSEGAWKEFWRMDKQHRPKVCFLPGRK